MHGQHDRARVAPNKLGIEIEAALAFGTGHHGTTRGCLLLLDHVLKAWRPRRVLDLGTGTGVLAIAAAKALHEKILASDIDPISVRVAQENARLNVSGHLVQAIPATGFSAPQFAQAGPFDLVLANILANPLRQLATPMARHLAPSALVILSGLLTHQAASVIAAYRARGLVPLRHLRIDGWSSLLLRERRLKTSLRGLSEPGAGDDAPCFLLLRWLRLTRASTNRSRIWTMTPRCFLAIGGIGPRRTGGEIFSNLKAGIVYPLFVELKHSWNSPLQHRINGLNGKPFRPV